MKKISLIFFFAFCALSPYAQNLTAYGGLTHSRDKENSTSKEYRFGYCTGVLLQEGPVLYRIEVSVQNYLIEGKYIHKTSVRHGFGVQAKLFETKKEGLFLQGGIFQDRQQAGYWLALNPQWGKWGLRVAVDIPIAYGIEVESLSLTYKF